MKILTAMTFVVCASVFSVNASNHQQAINNFRSSEATKEFFEQAYGYAVYPSVGKGGFGIGAAYGKGLVYLNDTQVGQSSLTQLSFGLQLGGQVYSQIIFFQDQRSFDEFTSGNFEFSAGASAVALTAAAQAQFSSAGISSSQGLAEDSTKQNRALYHKGMAVVALSKGGLMYEAVLAGQRYSYKALTKPKANGVEL